MAIVVAGFALWLFTPLGDLLDREFLLEQLENVRRSAWAAPVMIGLIAIFGLIGAPITAMVLANGAVFGPVWGLVANLAGTFVSGVTGFYLARALGKELFEHLLRRTGLESVEAVLERHGFWTLVRIRFIPIPFGIINYAAGLTPMKIGRFLAASAVPMVPVMAIYTYLGHALISVTAEDKDGLLWQAGAALFVLFLLSWLPGRRLRQEVAEEEEARS